MRFPWISRPAAANGGDAVVLVTWFRLKDSWRSPGFMLHSLLLWWQALRSPGLLGIAIEAHPFRGTFWTLSAWTDRRSLSAYTRTDPHGAAMDRIRPWMDEFERVSWTLPTADLPHTPTARPLWTDAAERVTQERRSRTSL
ncbi:hypothetical protein [Actinomadura parmotrematis]|uniref:DUF3291 domain-containing protein n=1 Tax=Actinomadura parmotrematis TaxID=2864039 RepID=A0ABS7FUD4_9ACTN|nr:hypothetical protein [Actinomadura parmotrematis]MBW8483931.1 hypothetical protein [Actinomadura parmotrematis]